MVIHLKILSRFLRSNLTQEESEKLNRPITLEEIGEVI